MGFRRAAFRLFYFLALLVPAPPPVRALGPEYVNLITRDNEHELDLLMGDFPWDGRDAFERSPTAYRIAGGSLNIRHLALNEELKARWSLAENRFWFRFRHRRRQDLARDFNENALELEVRPLGHWYISLLGDPAYHKAEATAGVALRWGLDEGRSLKFTHLWPNFDNNYAFHNHSVNEGYEEFYRRLPQETRLSLRWLQGPLSLIADGRLRRPSLKTRRELNSGEVLIHGNNENEFAGDLRYRAGAWMIGAEGERGYWRDDSGLDPFDIYANRTLQRNRKLGRLSASRRWGEKWATRVGGSWVKNRGILWYPGVPDWEFRYDLQDRIGFLFLTRRLGKSWSAEAGYLYDWQKSRSLNGWYWPTEDKFKIQAEHRGKTGLQWNISDGSYLKFVAGWELNRRDWGRYAYFDGGTILFQTALP